MESTESTDNSVETTQEGPNQEYVDLHEASDEDIAAFLEGADARESQAQVEQPQAEPTAKTEQKAEPPEEEADEEDLTVSRKELEALQKQLNGLELLNKRRTSELAEVKKQLKQFVQTNGQNLDEEFLESPTQAFAKARQIEMAQQKLQEVEAEEQALANAQQAQVLLAHHVGPDKLDVEAIAQSLVEDGMPQDFVQRFVSNPFQAALPETLIQLAKRANAEKRVRQMEQAMQQLVPYTQRLLEERKNIPQNVLKNVSSALRQAPQVTGSAGGTGQVGSRPVDFAQMSDQELREFLKGN
jgi:hypothetical protein